MRNLQLIPDTGRWLIGFLFGAALGLIVLGCSGLTWGYFMSSAASPPGTTKIIVIPENTTGAEIARMLADNGLIRSRLAFSLYVRLTGKDASLQAGTYSLNTGQSLPQIVDMLSTGRTLMVTFTIPEGFTLAQIADLLERQGLTDQETFYRVVSYTRFSYSFLQGIPPSRQRLEGFLFPDTYRVPRGASTKHLVDIMLARFQKEIKSLNYETRAAQLGLTVREAVTIASLIEREAKLDRERYLISGVIHNRLARNMPLQIDATVVYAMGRQPNRGVVTYRDLAIDSPYNTYLHPGLPPGPISSPGRTSLLAAVSPAKTPYLYYVARPDGSHAFARTLDEHNAYKRQYQR